MAVLENWPREEVGASTAASVAGPAHGSPGPEAERSNREGLETTRVGRNRDMEGAGKGALAKGSWDGVSRDLKLVRGGLG